MAENLAFCNFEEKYFKHEKIKVKKALSSFTLKDCIMGFISGALFGVGGAIIIPPENWKNLFFVFLAFPLWNSIYLRKVANTRHEIFIGKINNNNRHDVENFMTWAVPCSYKKTDVFLSKNYLRDNWICFMGPRFIHYSYNGKGGYIFNGLNHSDPVQMAFSNPSPDITFIAVPGHNRYSFLLMKYSNKKLQIMAHNYIQNQFIMVRTYEEENVESSCTTQGKFLAIQKDKTIKVAQIWSTLDPFINYIPGCIKNARLIHLDEDNRSILYLKNQSIYFQNFDCDCGILDENPDIYDEDLEDKILYPQPLLALDHELSFSNPIFTLIPKKNDNKYLFFKVTDDAFPRQQSVICINSLKKTWFYLTPSEIKLLDNPLFDIKSLAKLMQEKTNDPDTIFNLYKNDDRNLILKKAESAHKKPYYITVDSMLAFA